MNEEKILLIGKNSFVGKSIKKINNEDIKFISHKHIEDINFNNFSHILLCSQPQKYYYNKEIDFVFEKNFEKY